MRRGPETHHVVPNPKGGLGREGAAAPPAPAATTIPSGMRSITAGRSAAISTPSLRIHNRDGPNRWQRQSRQRSISANGLTVERVR